MHAAPKSRNSRHLFSAFSLLLWFACPQPCLAENILNKSPRIAISETLGTQGNTVRNTVINKEGCPTLSSCNLKTIENDAHSIIQSSENENFVMWRPESGSHIIDVNDQQQQKITISPNWNIRVIRNSVRK